MNTFKVIIKNTMLFKALKYYLGIGTGQTVNTGTATWWFPHVAR